MIAGRQNVLEGLAVTTYKRDDKEYECLVDRAFLAVMMRLRETNLLLNCEQVVRESIFVTG